ncbi:uncharacterized protein LOC129578366 [Sitodiplosis mosellana]|uniref:uncharacterized protein LOC129578366 n=1 Tax=Sitodiplosis mosellana TaxID=263140 RepID=UPI0024440BDC|nr:uncharacterized protein LOC129578366 [Sitodiplosis mosellana]
MALTGYPIFVIKILFGVCIGHLFAYQMHRPVHGPMHRGVPIPIPIRPLDHSTIRRLSRRPAELNPDSEPVFLPLHQSRHRPLQIMERISVPVDGNHNWNRQKKENFNVLNFEAYMMKPTNEALPKPVTERILRYINKTEDDRDDIRQSPSSHHKYRSRSIPKKPKKNPHVLHMKEFDDLEFYRAFLEHQKHAAMVKRLKPKPDSSSRLPIGIDFFESNKKKNKAAFPPITYSPLYLNNLHRSQQYEDVEASNVQNVKMRYPDMLKNEEIPSTQATTPFAHPVHEPTMQTTMIMPMESENHDETMPPPSEMPDEPETFHGLASEPEMYKFTIDDVVVKPNALGVVNNPFLGPVTLSPPAMMYQNTPHSNFMGPEHILPASANTIHETRYNPPHFQAQLSYPPKVYQRGTAYRRFQANSFRNVPIEASASSQQQVHKYSIEPVVTTQMTFATDAEQQNIAPSVKAAYEIDSKRVDNKRNKKRRMNTERHKPENSRKVNHQKDFLNNNLEFSNSYSKRRTQGVNSEEESATTPLIPSKLRHHNDFNKTEAKLQQQHQQQQEAITTTNVPKNEKVKYFQDTLTEQLTPHQIDVGHLSENPAGWEERYERKNLKSQRFQGKVKWGDRKGNFGEHYYDLNHHRNMKQSNNTRS